MWLGKGEPQRNFWKLTLGQTRTQETRNLLDQRVGSNESVVLASELLNELLVLVQLLQVVGAHLLHSQRLPLYYTHAIGM